MSTSKPTQAQSGESNQGKSSIATAPGGTEAPTVGTAGSNGKTARRFDLTDEEGVPARHAWTYDRPDEQNRTIKVPKDQSEKECFSSSGTENKPRYELLNEAIENAQLLQASKSKQGTSYDAAATAALEARQLELRELLYHDDIQYGSKRCQSFIPDQRKKFEDKTGKSGPSATLDEATVSRAVDTLLACVNNGRFLHRVLREKTNATNPSFCNDDGSLKDQTGPRKGLEEGLSSGLVTVSADHSGLDFTVQSGNHNLQYLDVSKAGFRVANGKLEYVPYDTTE